MGGKPFLSKTLLALPTAACSMNAQGSFKASVE